MFFKPNEYRENVSKINWKKLYKEGKKVLVFDLDNTLDVPDKETPTIVPELKELFDEIEGLGFKIIIFSNNKPERVESFSRHVEYKCIPDANKPFQKQYIKYFKEYNKDELVFIGDKVVTDVIGGNLYGGYTILVDPLTKRKKYWYTKVMATCELIFRTLVGFKPGDYYG